MDDILDASRLVSGTLHLEWKAVDLAAVVRAVVGGLQEQAAAKKVAALRGRPPGGPVVVGGDSIRLQQIVWNVVSNAVKFTPAAGRVDVRLAVEDGRGRPPRHGLRGRDRARVPALRVRPLPPGGQLAPRAPTAAWAWGSRW